VRLKNDARERFRENVCRVFDPWSVFNKEGAGLNVGANSVWKSSLTTGKRPELDWTQTDRTCYGLITEWRFGRKLRFGSAEECGRVRKSAEECGRVRKSAEECGRVWKSAEECGRVRKRIWIGLGFNLCVAPHQEFHELLWSTIKHFIVL
jgi:hypothetical protein